MGTVRALSLSKQGEQSMPRSESEPEGERGGGSEKVGIHNIAVPIKSVHLGNSVCIRITKTGSKKVQGQFHYFEWAWKEGAKQKQNKGAPVAMQWRFHILLVSVGRAVGQHFFYCRYFLSFLLILMFFRIFYFFTRMSGFGHLIRALGAQLNGGWSISAEDLNSFKAHFAYMNSM